MYGIYANIGGILMGSMLLLPYIDIYIYSSTMDPMGFPGGPTAIRGRDGSG